MLAGGRPQWSHSPQGLRRPLGRQRRQCRQRLHRHRLRRRQLGCQPPASARTSELASEWAHRQLGPGPSGCLPLPPPRGAAASSTRTRCGGSVQPPCGFGGGQRQPWLPNAPHAASTVTGKPMRWGVATRGSSHFYPLAPAPCQASGCRNEVRYPRGVGSLLAQKPCEPSPMLQAGPHGCAIMPGGSSAAWSAAMTIWPITPSLCARPTPPPFIEPYIPPLKLDGRRVPYPPRPGTESEFASAGVRSPPLPAATPPRRPRRPLGLAPTAPAGSHPPGGPRVVGAGASGLAASLVNQSRLAASPVNEFGLAANPVNQV